MNPKTNVTCLAMAACLSLAVPAPAAPGGGGGGNGGGGGGGSDPNVELCASYRDAAGDGITGDGLGDYCFDQSAKYYVLIWNDRDGNFRQKTQGGGRYPARPLHLDRSSCADDVTGVPCDFPLTDFDTELPLTTQAEFDPDGSGGWVPTGGDLDLDDMLEGEVSHAAIQLSGSHRWGPPGGSTAANTIGWPCPASDPVRVERIDADHWVIETEGSADVACSVDGSTRALLGYFHAPFRIELTRIP